MNILSQLKPAETLVLIEGKKVTLKNLMKYTFMDLVLKQVLVVKESVNTYKSGRGYREVRSKYVIKGKNFDNYKYTSYENIYLSVFHKSPELKAVLTKLIKVAYEAVSSEKEYRKSIINTSPIKNQFKSNFFQQLIGSFSLTPEGQASKQEVQNRLQEIDSQIADLLKFQPQKALELLVEIGGNIFLLKNLDFELLRKIDATLLQSLNVDNHYDSYSNDSGWWYYLDFSDDTWLDSTFDSWDSTFDSFESSYDAAGCSSHDSGCSSCSGCGGCGGCN